MFSVRTSEIRKRRTYVVLEEILGSGLADMLAGLLTDGVRLDEVGEEGETKTDVEVTDDQRGAYEQTL